VQASSREHGAFTLDVDALARISAVLGIHQGLGVLIPTEQLDVERLRAPHGAVVFGGLPPLAASAAKILLKTPSRLQRMKRL
jgi:hypothetical protein